MFWNQIVDVKDFARFMLHGKTEPAHLQVLIQTLSDVAEFLLSSNFEALPVDEKGGIKSYDIYLFAPDEKVGVAGDEKHGTYLQSAYGYVQPAGEIISTEHNSQDYHSYMVLDNGLPLHPENKSAVKNETDARLTLVHELFHSVQFALAAEDDVAWFTEGCATASEVLFELYFAATRAPQYQTIFDEYGKTFLNNMHTGLYSNEPPTLPYGTYLLILFVLQTAVKNGRFPNVRTAMQQMWSRARAIAVANTGALQATSITKAVTWTFFSNHSTEHGVELVLLDFLTSCAQAILRSRGADAVDSTWTDELRGVQTQLEHYLVPTNDNEAKTPNPTVVVVLSGDNNNTLVYHDNLAPLGGSIYFVPVSGTLEIPIPPPNHIARVVARKHDGRVVITENAAATSFSPSDYLEVLVCLVKMAPVIG